MSHEPHTGKEAQAWNTCMPEWSWRPVVQNSKACSVACALIFSVMTARHWRGCHFGVNRRGGIHRALGMGMHARVLRMYYACVMLVVHMPYACLCHTCDTHACATHACVLPRISLHAVGSCGLHHDYWIHCCMPCIDLTCNVIPRQTMWHSMSSIC